MTVQYFIQVDFLTTGASLCLPNARPAKYAAESPPQAKPKIRKNKIQRIVAVCRSRQKLLEINEGIKAEHDDAGKPVSYTHLGFRVTETIHAAHFRMQMQLHTLFRRRVHTLFPHHLQHVIRVNDIIALVCGIGTVALDEDVYKRQAMSSLVASVLTMKNADCSEK